MKKRILKNMEWWIVIWGIALSIIGLTALFSATSETDYKEFTKQIIWIVVSIITMLIMVIFIEILQFVLLTGSCDIDDVILNVLGACIAYKVFNAKIIKNFITKITTL